MNPYLLINLKLNWPTVPTNLYTDNLMLNFSHRSKVLYVLEATKMVLPIWEEFAIKNEILSTDQKEVPKKIVESIEMWLGGRLTESELRDKLIKVSSLATKAASLAVALGSVRPFDTLAKAAGQAAYSAVFLISVALREADTFHTIFRVADIIDSAREAYAIFDTSFQFCNEWWDRCYILMKKEYDVLCNRIINDL